MLKVWTFLGILVLILALWVYVLALKLFGALMSTKFNYLQLRMEYGMPEDIKDYYRTKQQPIFKQNDEPYTRQTSDNLNVPQYITDKLRLVRRNIYQVNHPTYIVKIGNNKSLEYSKFLGKAVELAKY
ncbi:hypothetical protein BB561_002622 [Smittium simulii]|uniref:Uncharacterized protein n=1 Tax=Smittium simulii TaxID=133385 RepID=A0A2T9YPX2_9FUNG|nr:hypothetical protein BB561_002622 [Smittium simulii]